MIPRRADVWPAALSIGEARLTVATRRLPCRAERASSAWRDIGVCNRRSSRTTLKLGAKGRPRALVWVVVADD